MDCSCNSANRCCLSQVGHALSLRKLVLNLQVTRHGVQTGSGFIYMARVGIGLACVSQLMESDVILACGKSWQTRQKLLE